LIDNCILLTNELIAKVPLQAEDQIGFLAHQEKMVTKMEAKKEKRKKSVQKSKENRAKRIQVMKGE